MKKYLIIISAFVLTTVSTSQLVENMISANILKPLIKKENEEVKKFTELNDEQKIDFNKVENYFKDEKNKTNNKFNGISSYDTLKIRSQVDNAFAKSLEYTNEIKQKKLSLDQIMTKFKNEIPRFKTVYERSQKNFLKNKEIAIKNMSNNNLLKNSIKNIKNYDENKMKIEALEFWNKLDEFKIGFITTAAISAILAAGMWAAAWAGGISIPWAVAATITAVTCTAVAEAINIYMVNNAPLIDKIDQNIEIALSATGIAYAFFRDLYAIIQFSLVTIGTTSVITAAGAAIFTVGIAIFTWITRTDIFTQIENSKNEEIKQWVQDSKNGIVKKYKFEYKKEGGMWDESYNVDYYTIKLIKWTDYTSSIEEFKQVFKYVGFKNFLAEAGGQGDTIKKENLLIPTSDFITDIINQKKIINYNYSNWIGTEQNAIWYVYTTIAMGDHSIPINDSLFLNSSFVTKSYHAIYHVFLNIRFDDCFLTI